MPDYDVIVIGAGNGGLTSSAMLAKGGKRVLLIEKHNVPGECATSFRRGRFEFEVALHQLSGMGSQEKPGPLRSILRELEVEEKIDWVWMHNLYRMVLPGRFDITLPSNKEGAISALQSNFPAEKENIKNFFDLVYSYIVEWFKITQTKQDDISREKFPLYFKYHLKTAQEVVEEFFTDQNLQTVINFYWCYLGVPPKKIAFEAMILCLFAYIEFKPYHLKGGSQMMSAALTETLRKYGGDVRFNTPVESIIVKDNRVCGVVAGDGERYTAPYIVSNISPVHTYVNLMDPSDIPPEALYNLGSNRIGVSAFILYIGLDCPPREVGFTESMNVFCSEAGLDEGFLGLKTIDTEKDPFIVSCYNLDDPHFSPEGTSQVAVVCLKYGEPWIELPPEQYHETKYRCADTLLRRIESQFPGFREHIEEIEAATPITCMRYLGHPGGAIYGFDKEVKDTGYFFQTRSHVQGLYFAGTWTGWDGFQPTLSSGYSTARKILKQMSMEVK